MLVRGFKIAQNCQRNKKSCIYYIITDEKVKKYILAMFYWETLLKFTSFMPFDCFRPFRTLIPHQLQYLESLLIFAKNLTFTRFIVRTQQNQKSSAKRSESIVLFWNNVKKRLITPSHSRLFFSNLFRTLLIKITFSN